jgi:hypothetical protein
MINTFGKKDREILDYSTPDRIMSNGHWNFFYPSILQDNSDLLAKKRRNRFVIPLQYYQEQEKELISCLGISIEIPFMGILRRSTSTYPMRVFKFYEGLCEELMKMRRDIWWGDENERQRMQWMSWDKITKREGQGDMGYRDLHIFNQALQARHAWRLTAYPHSLCVRLLKSKYYLVGELTDTAFTQNHPLDGKE